MSITKTIHHVNKDCTHEVIEKLIVIFGFVVKRSLTTKML